MKHGTIQQSDRTVFTTTDHEEFVDHDKAKRHQAKIDLGAFLIEEAVGSGGPWDQTMFLNFLIDHANELYHPLAALCGRPS